MKKSKILEILDSKEVIIGQDDQPQVDNNEKTKSKFTTDKNIGISHQNYQDTYIGSLGFSPFLYETIDDDQLKTMTEELVKKKEDKMPSKKKNNDVIDKKLKTIKDVFSKSKTTDIFNKK